MNMKETAHHMKNNWVTSTTADSKLEMMSLYDYLGYAAGGSLGKIVAEVAKRRSIRMESRYVSNKKYKGEILLYPKYFLDWYFNEDDDTALYKHNNTSFS